MLHPAGTEQSLLMLGKNVDPPSTIVFMSKRILIAGGYPHHLVLEVEKGFQKAGWQTEFFDTSTESPYYRPFIKPLSKLIHNLRIQRHPEIFKDSPISNLGWRSTRWVKKIRETRPDLALVINGNRFGLPWLKEAAALCPVACWMVEPFGRLDRLIEASQAGVYRKLLVYAHNYVGELAQHEIESKFYPHRAAETPPETQVCNRDRRYDWSFLGSHSPWREKCLSAVIERYPNGFIMGPRWDRVAKRDPAFRPVVHTGYYGKEKAFQLYLDSRIGLDIGTSNTTNRNGATMRSMELLACGCLLLCQSNDEIGCLPWNISARTRIFSTPTELQMLIGTELVHPESEQDRLATMEIAQKVAGYGELIKAIEVYC